MSIRQILNRSTHERMISGDSYSLSAISTITGIHQNTLHGRLRGKSEFTDHDLRVADITRSRTRRKSSPNMFLRLESDADRLSQKYLRGAL